MARLRLFLLKKIIASLWFFKQICFWWDFNIPGYSHPKKCHLKLNLQRNRIFHSRDLAIELSLSIKNSTINIWAEWEVGFYIEYVK